MPRVQVGEENGHAIELYYEDYGTGRPVVLIHGWPLSGRAWESQVHALVADGYRVVVPDRRGFGKSSQPWGGYDYDTFASDLGTLIDTLELTDVTLVGFSMGGGEVARYTGGLGGGKNGKVTKVVFAGAVPPYLYKSDDNPDGGLDDATITQFEDGVRGDRLAFLDGFVSGFFGVNGKELVSPAQHAYAVSVASYASPKGTLDCIAAFGRTDFRKDLELITVPTLVIHGDSDAIVPFEVSGKRTAEAIPDAKLVLVPGAPHGLNVTHADTFNAELLAFLRS
jgi:pimeloyl-ACP methyl ester carboxylesterase